MASYRDAIIERHRRAQATRRADMRNEAGRLACAAAERFSFTRMYLVGSVAGSRPLSVWSDIDIAVEGLDPERFLELAGALTAQTRYEVDLKPLEEMPEAERKRIALEGVLLYERR